MVDESWNDGDGIAQRIWESELEEVGDSSDRWEFKDRGDAKERLNLRRKRGCAK